MKPFNLQQALNEKLIVLNGNLPIKSQGEYEGQFDSTYFEGVGRSVFKHSIFEGMFFKNQPNGYGRKIYDCGTVEEGFFKDNVLSGQGVRIRTDGLIVKSYWKDGMITGKK